ncbi:unnamed protein product [Caenorhabditis sp. 36 PRJEB53466]|nr:unnamed protein product [Caenorhabditis sp. 36 PRJEB53466]
MTERFNEVTGLECKVCFEHYSGTIVDLTPRMLSCGHSLFDGDVRLLPKNFDLLELLASLPKTSPIIPESPKVPVKKPQALDPSNTPCAEDPSHEATCFCAQCSADLCEKCFDMVHRPRSVAAHAKIPIAEKPIQLPKCQSHPSNIAEYVCREPNCQMISKIICDKCVLKDHKNHKYELLSEYTEKYLRKLRNCLDGVVSNETSLERASESLKMCASSYEETSPDYQQVIKKVQDFFKSEEAKAIRKLTEIAGQERQRIRGEQSRIGGDLEEIRSVKEELNKVLKSKEYLISTDRLVEKAKSVISKSMPNSPIPFRKWSIEFPKNVEVEVHSPHLKPTLEQKREPAGETANNRPKDYSELQIPGDKIVARSEALAIVSHHDSDFLVSYDIWIALHSLFHHLKSNYNAFSCEELTECRRLVPIVMKRWLSIKPFQLSGIECFFKLFNATTIEQIPAEEVNACVERCLDAVEHFPGSETLQNTVWAFIVSVAHIVKLEATNFTRLLAVALDTLVNTAHSTVGAATIRTVSVIAPSVETSVINRLMCDSKYVLGIVQLMNVWVNVCQGRGDKQDLIVVALHALWNLSDNSPTTCRTFVEVGGLLVVSELLELPNFPETTKGLVLGVLSNVSEVDDLRLPLHEHHSILLPYLNGRFSETEWAATFSAAIIFSNFLANPLCWRSTNQREEIDKLLLEAVAKFSTSESLMFSYKSFEPFCVLIRTSKSNGAILTCLYGVFYALQTHRSPENPSLVRGKTHIEMYHQSELPSMIRQFRSSRSPYIDNVDTRVQQLAFRIEKTVTLAGFLLLVTSTSTTDATVYSRVKRNDFTNNYGYGPFGIGPTNGGFDSFGFYRDKFYNSGLPPLYTHAAYRNYYHEISFHKNKYGQPAPTDFEVLQQERFGPYYDGVWGYADHSKNWFGKR